MEMKALDAVISSPMGSDTGISVNPFELSVFNAVPLAFCSASYYYLRRRTRYDRVGSFHTSLLVADVSRLPSLATNRFSSRLHGQKGEDDGNPVFTLIETTASIFSKPVLVGSLDPPLVLGYPIVLLAGIWVLPFVTSALLVVCYSGYAWFGRSVVLSDWETDDEEERPPVDLLALGAATVTSGLLAPFDSAVANRASPLFQNDFILVPLIATAFALLLFATINRIEAGDPGQAGEVVSLESEEDDTPPIGSVTMNERKLMDLWDQSLKGKGVNVDNLDDEVN